MVLSVSETARERAKRVARWTALLDYLEQRWRLYDGDGDDVNSTSVAISPGNNGGNDHTDSRFGDEKQSNNDDDDDSLFECPRISQSVRRLSSSRPLGLPLPVSRLAQPSASVLSALHLNGCGLCDSDVEQLVLLIYSYRPDHCEPVRVRKHAAVTVTPARGALVELQLKRSCFWILTHEFWGEDLCTHMCVCT